jgi:hypothetical protein
VTATQDAAHEGDAEPNAIDAPGTAEEEELPAGTAASIWLATTDADSLMPPDWLARQLRYAADGWEAVAGTVAVTDWTGHAPGTAAEYARQYGVYRGSHPHVHGAKPRFHRTGLPGRGRLPAAAHR